MGLSAAPACISHFMLPLCYAYARHSTGPGTWVRDNTDSLGTPRAVPHCGGAAQSGI